MRTNWDCIVVGGGAAGLSAALVLGRALRRTLVVDAGDQSNRPAHGIGGLLGQDGRPPAAFYADGRRELAAYASVELRDGEVVGAERRDGGFRLRLADGGTEDAARLLLATGIDYGYPDVPGLAERWGGAVFHCPFCHGWEVRGRPLGVLDGGPQGAQRALLLRNWTDDVTLLTNGPATLDAAARERLRAAGIPVDERRVAGVRGAGEDVEAVIFADGAELACAGLLVGPVMRARSALAAQLGARLGEPDAMVAAAVEIDATFRTSVPGVFAAGDVSPRMPSVANAVAAGSSAAAMIVHDLVDEAYPE